MGASKKQRGKQRKADKNKKKAAAGGVSVNISAQISPNNLVALIQRGDHTATDLYSTGCGILSRVQTDKVVTSVLGFLQRCENETFDNVMAGLGGDLVCHVLAGIDGGLKCPSIWINTLSRACESTSMDPRVCLRISQSIGPLVKCMCDDKKMLFFQSKHHWIESLTSFVALIRYILHEVKTDKQKITGALLNHEGLLRSIVQWSHIWDTRPDITSILDEHNCDIIYNCGRHSIRDLVIDVPDLREVIASTPTINKDYVPNCKVSHIAGMISQLKTRGWEGNDFQILHHLIVDADCVDRGVIEGIIDFGLDVISNTDPELSADTVITVSAHVTNISRAMIHHVGGSPSDTRVSSAIRAGLIDLCLSLMRRFGGQVTNQNDSEKLFRYIEGIFKAVHGVALHKKTWKAIRHERPDIEDKLEHLDAIITHDSGKYNELLHMIKSILDINGAYCCHCNKSLGRKERFQCGECNRMTYCSRSCQRSDWFNRHSHACCKTYDDDNCGQFQGRIIPTTIPEDERAASKLEELEINNNMIQLKLFLDYSSTILEQAKYLNIPLCDCIVKFDLFRCPPKVTTNHYSELYYDESVGKRGYEASRSMKNITCVFSSHNFIEGATDHLDQDNATLLAVQRLFPCEWLTQKK